MTPYGTLAPLFRGRDETETPAELEARQKRVDAIVEKLRSSRATEERPKPWADRTTYSADYNSTSQTPPSVNAGVATAYGRVWAEGRALVNSAGAGAFVVSLVATQNGLRCAVEADVGATVEGGSVRFWVQDTETLKWSLTSVEEVLPTGAQRVSTSDQFITVGAR